MSDGAPEGERGSDDERRRDREQRRPDGGEPVESVDRRTVDPQEVVDLRQEIEDVRADLESKTRAREDLESDLRRYVRWRQRRGHARGWGPYIVLLYGTIMTLGAFYYLSGVHAVLSMLVIWLSTLGLYTLMLIVGWLGAAVGRSGQVVERVRDLR